MRDWKMQDLDNERSIPNGTQYAQGTLAGRDFNTYRPTAFCADET